MEDDVGQVAGKKGENAAAGTRQMDGGVEDGCADGSGQNSGKVNENYPTASVNHLQRNADEQLKTFKQIVFLTIILKKL